MKRPAPTSAPSRFSNLYDRLEPLESQREPIPIRVILDAAWQMDDLAIQTLQAIEHRAVVLRTNDRASGRGVFCPKVRNSLSKSRREMLGRDAIGLARLLLAIGLLANDRG
jgi:hypothetical protein